jgi:tripartite-type tricarboxylate transporter receptor subunit TctC
MSKVCHCLALGVVILVSNSLHAQDYPTKTIRMVTSSAGSGTDFVARQIAQGISGALGQQMIVDNRPSGVIPGEVVAKSAPDGYTLLTAGNLWIGPLIQKTPYDAVRDFAPVSLVARSPNVVVVHPSLPVKSVKELIALAKAKPGELNYGSAGAGGSSHLGAELFKYMAGVNVVWVPYKGAALAVRGLMGGETQMMITDVNNVPAQVHSGRLRALAVTSAEPSALAPGLPTVSSTGLPGYEFVGMTGVLAPARTPAPIIRRLSDEIARFVRTPGAKEAFFNSGADTVGSTPEELAAAIQADMARMSKMIKAIGLRID